MIPRKTIFFTLLLGFSILSTNGYAKVSLEDLRINYQTTPLGIAIEKPRFSWRMAGDSNTRGLRQEAYHILIVDEENQTAWDTKKVDSDISLGIAYAGSALKPTTRYTWTVTVWANTGEQASQSSWFETGLMNADPGLAAWSGATWIAETMKTWYYRHTTCPYLKYSINYNWIRLPPVRKLLSYLEATMID